MKSIYAVRENGKVLYVGQSVDIKRRMYQHRYHDDFPMGNNAEIFSLEIPTLWGRGKGYTKAVNEIENFAIYALRPVYNKNSRGWTGGGRSTCTRTIIAHHEIKEFLDTVDPAGWNFLADTLIY